MRRSPQEVVDTLAYALKSGRPGNEFKVSDIVKKTSMNHTTVMYYLDLIVHVQSNLPVIEVVEKKRNTFVRILREVELPFSEEEHMLLLLFDKGAFTKSTATQFDEGSKPLLDKMLGSSLLMQVSKKVYLSTEGIVRAAGLADIRAEAVLSPIKEKVFEKGEIKIEEWRIKEDLEVASGHSINEYISMIFDVPVYPAAI